MLCFNFYRAFFLELSMSRSHDSLFVSINKFKFARFFCIAFLLHRYILIRLFRIEIMITFKLVEFKRSLSNIIVTINNEAIKKRKVKKSFDSFALSSFASSTNSIEHSNDTTFVRRKSRKSSKAKNKSREPRATLYTNFFQIVNIY